MLALKTNKVDKINPFHINMLLGQIIEIEETGYVRIVTEYGKVNTLITPSQLYPCTASNMKLDFSTKTSFIGDCIQSLVSAANGFGITGKARRSPNSSTS